MAASQTGSAQVDPNRCRTCLEPVQYGELCPNLIEAMRLNEPIYAAWRKRYGVPSAADVEKVVNGR